MPVSSKHEHIVCLAFPAWEADYLRSTVELMKCLSENNLVLYVDYAYTISDCFKAIRGKKKLDWKRLLGFKTRLQKIEGNGITGLYLLSLPPVFPSFKLPSFSLFSKANQINALITGYTINKAVKKLNMKDVIAFNAFQPFLGRWWKLKSETFKVFYCYDDITEMPFFKGYVAESEKQIIRKSDLLVVTSDVLKERKSVANIPSEIVYNGVHFQSFFQHASLNANNASQKITVGYTGSIDERIDISLLEPVIKALPQVDFNFTGKIVDPNVHKRLSVYPNVQFHPPVAADAIPVLMSKMSVGIIPYKINVLTQAIYPLKVNEYLAMGLPVVMTPFASLGETDNVVYRAATSDMFIKAIHHAIAHNSEDRRQQRIKSAEKADWHQRAHQLLSLIQMYKAKKQTQAA